MTCFPAILFMMLLCCSRAHRGKALGFSIQYSSRRISTFQLHVSNKNKATLYTINDENCPPLPTKVLRATVEKHCQTLDRYLQQRPIAKHTREAFDKVSNYILDNKTPIVLDSGCGTGRSSMLLGEMYPSHVVIGIDRSMARLSRNQKFQTEYGVVDDITNANDGETPFDKDTSMDSSVPTVQQAADNVYLVRAELVDFWRLTLSHHWNVTHHYLLYPNPYPKKKRYKLRWYAHPSFPLLLQLGGNMFIRSNWKGYLQEFCASVIMADEYYQQNEDTDNVAMEYVESARRGPTERLDKLLAWTNFEQKYDNVGESTYELKLNV